MEPDPRAAAFVARALGPGARIEPLAGDASTRRFYRITGADRGAILMVHPEPLDPSSPLFSNHRILTAIGAPVPRLIDHDDRTGLVLVEDLGETTLQSLLAGGRPPGVATRENAGKHYREACDLIVRFHQRAPAALEPGDFASANALDRERFLAEFDHFHRYYFLGLRGRRPSTAEQSILNDFYADLARICDEMPQVYCHRDFQSRNLMVLEGRLRLIDFQDARMGPYTYDAASLLRDSSIDIEEPLVEEMLAYLSDRLGHRSDILRRDFDRAALQRNIKDLGTFAYQASECGRRDYLDYVPRTLRSIRAALLREQRYHPLFDLLDRLFAAPAG